MREIKFRAWNKISNGFVDDMQFRASIQADGTINTTGSVLELMQYTGLKDKNGVEIYIGDILQTDHYGVMEVIYDERHQQYLAYPREKGAMTCPDLFGSIWYANQYDYVWDDEYKKYWDEDDNRPINECEVIGNIYENPELLKG